MEDWFALKAFKNSVLLQASCVLHFVGNKVSVLAVSATVSQDFKGSIQQIVLVPLDTFLTTNLHASLVKLRIVKLANNLGNVVSVNKDILQILLTVTVRNAHITAWIARIKMGNVSNANLITNPLEMKWVALMLNWSLIHLFENYFHSDNGFLRSTS